MKHMYMHTRTCTHTLHVHVHVHVHAHAHIHEHTYMHTRTCTHIHAHTYMNTHEHTYMHTHVHTQSRKGFTDLDFPPNDLSLYGRGGTAPPQWKGIYKWLRPANVVDPTNPRMKWTVFRNPCPEDIAQGVLGNCW